MQQSFIVLRYKFRPWQHSKRELQDLQHIVMEMRPCLRAVSAVTFIHSWSLHWTEVKVSRSSYWSSTRLNPVSGVRAASRCEGVPYSNWNQTGKRPFQAAVFSISIAHLKELLPCQSPYVSLLSSLPLLWSLTALSLVIWQGHVGNNILQKYIISNHECP